jgi:hypothetical protein
VVQSINAKKVSWNRRNKAIRSALCNDVKLRRCKGLGQPVSHA